MSKKRSKVYVIGDSPVQGYVVFGKHTLAEARAAIDEAYGADAHEWPDDIRIEHTPCRLECWMCGGRHADPTERCDGDDEGHVWNFRAGRMATVVMVDGRSVFERFGKQSDLG